MRRRNCLAGTTFEFRLSAVLARAFVRFKRRRRENVLAGMLRLSVVHNNSNNLIVSLLCTSCNYFARPARLSPGRFLTHISPSVLPLLADPSAHRPNSIPCHWGAFNAKRKTSPCSCIGTVPITLSMPMMSVPAAADGTDVMCGHQQFYYVLLTWQLRPRPTTKCIVSARYQPLRLVLSETNDFRCLSRCRRLSFACILAVVQNAFNIPKYFTAP